MFRSSKVRAFYMLTLICLIYLLDYADRKVMSSLFPFIQQEWGISDTQSGMLNGIVSLMISVFVIPMSILVDRWSRKKMIALMAFVWSIATLLCAFADNYTQLLVFRAMTGLGEAAYAPAAIAMLARFFPRHHRAKYIGIYDAASPIGAGIGMMLGGYIGMMYGWRHAFGLVALPGIILSVLFIFVNDYATVQTAAEKALSLAKQISRSSLRLFRVRTLWLIYFAYALIIGVETSVLDWIPSFFHRFHGLDEKQSGMASGILAVAVLIGAPLGGITADIWGRKNKHAKVYVSAFTTIASVFFLFAAIQVQNLAQSLILFGLFGVTTVAYLAPASTMIQEVVPTQVRALAFGVNVLIMNLLGAFAMPVLIGKISDMVNLRFALSFLPILAIISTVLFLLSKNVYQKDLQRVHEESHQ